MQVTINTLGIRRRVEKLEKKINPDNDRGFTMEELRRSMWTNDKGRFIELARGEHRNLRYLIPQFVAEDTEHTKRVRSTKTPSDRDRSFRRTAAHR